MDVLGLAARWPSDAEIAERVIGGEALLFGTLVRRYGERLFRASRAILGQDEAAEEAARRALVSTYGHLWHRDEAIPFPVWITRFAVWQATGARLLRGQPAVGARAALALAIAGSRDDGGARETTDVRTALRRAVLELVVDRLPEEYRLVIVLCLVEGMPTDETAACLRCGDVTVRMRLHWARRTLRDELGADPERDLRRIFCFGGECLDRMAGQVLEMI